MVKSSALTDDADNSGTVTPGDTLTYMFVVENRHGRTIRDVCLRDTLLDTWDADFSAFVCDMGALPLGLRRDTALTCLAEYAVTGADAEAGRIVNTVTASVSKSKYANWDTQSTKVDPTPDPRIRIAKSRSDANPLAVDEDSTYSLDVVNAGNVTLYDVTVDDHLDGLTGLKCAPASGSSLPPGETMVCTATYPVTQTDVDRGYVSNTATVTAKGSDGNGDDVTGTDDRRLDVAQRLEIMIAKSMVPNADGDGSKDVSVDDALTYQFDVVNAGSVTLYDVTVDDHLDGLSDSSALLTAPSWRPRLRLEDHREPLRLHRCAVQPGLPAQRRSELASCACTHPVLRPRPVAGPPNRDKGDRFGGHSRFRLPVELGPALHRIAGLAAPGRGDGPGRRRSCVAARGRPPPGASRAQAGATL